MKAMKRTTFLFAAVFAGLQLFAANPVAVWNAFSTTEGLTQGDYTLHIGDGSTVSSGALVIGRKAAWITRSNNSSVGAISVEVEYSLSAGALSPAANLAFLSFGLASATPTTAAANVKQNLVTIGWKNATTLAQGWAQADKITVQGDTNWGYNEAAYTPPASGEHHTLTITYGSSNRGTTTYKNGASLIAYKAGLRGGVDYTIYLGHRYHDTADTSYSYVWTGMTIHGIKIFESEISSSDVSSSYSAAIDLGGDRLLSREVRANQTVNVALSDAEAQAGTTAIQAPSLAQTTLTVAATYRGEAVTLKSTTADTSTHTITITYDPMGAQDFTATAASGTFSGQSWSPSPFAYGPLNTATLNAPNAADITFSDAATLNRLVVVGAGATSFTVANGIANPVITAYDFSGATGTTTVGYDTGAATIAAGSDTVLNGTGSGLITMAANQKVTVGNNHFGGNFDAGNGTKVVGPATSTLAFDLGANNTQKITGSNNAGADRKFGLTVKSGTLAFEYSGASATVFNGRTVTADGANAVVKLVNGDATGWGGGCTKIVARNGGKLLFARRDTLRAPIELDSGTFELASGCANSSGRALDLYGNGATKVNSAWTVSGTSAIVANSTTADDREILLRDKNWDITVNAGGVFTVNATLIANEFPTSGTGSADGTRGKLVKKGTGTIVLAAESRYETGTEVQLGTARAEASAAFGTGAVAVSAGAKVELNAPESASYTLSSAITGAGTVEKIGTGLFTLTGANELTGNITVSAGTLRIEAGTLGTLTVASGATVELGDGVTATSIVGPGTVRKIGTGATAIAAGVVSKATKPAAIEVAEGTLTLGTANTLFFGTAENAALPLTVTGGTLDLSNAISFSLTDASGWLYSKAITVGGATAASIVGGALTPYYAGDLEMLRYVGNDGANEPATVSTAIYSTYQTVDRVRSINVEAGKGSTVDNSYDLNMTGVLGIHNDANYLKAFKLKKTGSGVLRVSNANNFPNTTVEAGTYQLGCAAAMPANLVVGASGTLDLNGFSVTNVAITCSGRIANTSAKTVEIVSKGRTVDLNSATIDDNIVLKASLADAVAGVRPFILPAGKYASVQFDGQLPDMLEYDLGTGIFKFKSDCKLGDDLVWLPIGDSITEGEQYMGHPGEGTSESRGGYRYQLWNDLEQGGQQTRSVGYRTGHCGTVENTRWAWHAAQYGGVIMHDNNGNHGATGMNVENILEAAGYPDIATILIAVNDLSFSGDNAKVFETWKRMVVKYAEKRPNTRVVVSTLLPAGKNRMTYIGPFNALVRGAHTAGTAPFDKANVVFADIAQIAFGNEVFLEYYKASDALHPNEEGAKVVGKAFASVLQGQVAALAKATAKPVAVHNGAAGKATVRFSKKIASIDAATLTVSGTDVDGIDREWIFDSPAIGADARTVEFAVGDNVLLGGIYTATLSDVSGTDGNGLALESSYSVADPQFVEILGTGADKNIPQGYRQGFEKLQTVEIADGTVTDGIGSGVNYGGDGPAAVVRTLSGGAAISRVGYYVELQRANEPPQFVWASMSAEAFGFVTNNVGVPTVGTGNRKQTVASLQVYGNRGNFTNTAADDMSQTGVIEFSPWTATSADQSNFPTEFKGNHFGWNDTLGEASSGLKGCMQVARATGVSPTDDYTQLAGEMVFAFNNFNCDTATDIGIGTFSTHRNNAGSPDITPVIDWTDFVSNSKFAKLAVNAYAVKKIEIWAMPFSEFSTIMDGDKAFSQLAWHPTRPDTFSTDAMLTITNTAAAKLTVDEDVSVAEIAVVNTGAKLTIANATRLRAAAYDFTEATGKVAFDCTGLTTHTTLISGTIAGIENIDTTTGIPDGGTLLVSENEVRLVFNAKYQKFGYGTVYTWLTGNSGSTIDFTGGDSNFQAFDITTCKDLPTVYHGNTTYGGQAFWKLFAHATGISTTYTAPGEIWRFAQGDYCTSIGASYGPMTIGGIIAEPGDAGWTFIHTSGTRSTLLGDPTAETPTFFDIGANVTFNRNGTFYLAGTMTFDIASGKTFNLNASQNFELALLNTVEAAGSGAFGTTTAGGTLVMKGAGTLQVKTLKALGSTLDYSNVPLSRETSYINGTLQIDGDTILKLPAGLAANTPFKLATALDGAADGNRTIYIGGVEQIKAVTFNAAEGTMSWAEPPTYVARIDETAAQYETLAEALTAVQSGQTLTLLATCGEAMSTDKTFAFVPNGYTFGGTVTVNAGGVLTIDGGDACTIASVVNIANGGKLVTKGTLSLSNSGNTAESGSALEVATGTLTYECGKQALDADITIQSGAKFVQGATTRQDDQFQYANAHTINIYGTLDLGTSRWSVKNNTTINLYPGALIQGVGQGAYGAIDAADSTVAINAKKNGGVGGTATISARLRPRGNPGFVYSVEEGMTLALTGTLGDKYNGFRKEGTGTLYVSSTYATTGKITLAGGTVKIGAAGSLGTSPLAFAGGTLDLNGQTLSGKTASGSGKIVNTSNSAASYNGVPVAKDAEFDVEGGVVTITLEENEELTLPSVPEANTVRFSGAGKVIYNNATVPTLPAGIWADDWTGTFRYTGLDGAANGWDWSSYYNGTLSKFEFAGKMTGGYLPRQVQNLGELVLAGTIVTTDGFTKLSDDKTYVHYDFTKLSGSGTIRSAVTTSAKPIYWFKDASAFTGMIAVEGDSGAMRFVIGSEAGGAYGEDVPAVRAVSFAGTAMLGGMTIDATGGVVAQSGAVVTVPAGATAPKSSSPMMFEDGSSVVLSDMDSQLNANGGMTVDDGVTIPVAVANATGLAADKVLIGWPSQPAGGFTLKVGEGVEKGAAGFKAVKGDSGLSVAADETKTFYEFGDSSEPDRPTVMFENQWMMDAEITGTTEEKQQKLDTTNANGIKPSEAYLMGYTATEAKTAAIVISPQQTTLANKVRLTLAGVPGPSKRRNDAVVTYKVKSSTSQAMTEPVERDIGESTMVDMELPESGVIYYQIEADIDVSGSQSATVPAVVPSANIVAAGMPLTTEPGAQFAASLGTTTLTEATASLTVKLAGAGVYEGQEYHLSVSEANASPLQMKASSANDNATAYGMVAKVLSDKTVTFDFGHVVAAGSTCTLTLLGEGGAANGNIAVVSPTMTGTTANMENVIVSMRVCLLPYDEGIATMAAPAMPQQVRIPAIATDGKGEVIACYDVRYGKSDLGAHDWDSGNGDGYCFSGIDIGENYSSDGGKTFGKVRLAVDVPNMRDQTGAWIGGYANRNNANYVNKTNDLGDVCILYNPNDQKYWMMGITGGGLTTTGTNTDKADVVLYTRAKGKDSPWMEWNNGGGSTDKMIYRSVKQQIITSLGKQPSELHKGFLQGPGHGIVTTKANGSIPAGTLVFPIQCFFSDGTHSGAAYSTDGGAHWQATALTDTDSAPQENCIMELDDGSWYMCTKCNGAGYYRCYRYDQSNNSWVKVENGAPCPNAREGSCVRMGVGSDGKGRYAICHARNDRSNVVVYFGVDNSSADIGITWDWDHYVTIHKDNTNGGYSSMCMVDDTTLGILYESSSLAATDGGCDTSGCRMYFTRIDVSDKVVGPAAN